MSEDSGAEEVAFVSTTPGLEPALEGELRALGLEATRVDGGFEVRGQVGLHRTLCLRLRTASHVLLRLGSFPFRDVPGLEDGLRRVSIVRFRTSDSPRVRGFVKRSHLSAEQVEGGARRAWGLAEAADPDGTHFLVRVDGSMCSVSVDCAGEFLYRRGYRQEVSMAPLRETLAAGLLLLAGYDGSEALVDPFCGSGTLLIEAAWIGMGRPPGFGRAFEFERWDGAVPFTPHPQETGAATSMICGSDIHAGALGVARRNAKRAGVFERLRLERTDAASVSPPAGVDSGLVVANLPYGKRASETAQLRSIYAAFGARLSSAFRGWRAAVLFADARLEPLLRIQPAKVFELDNGGIPCRLVTGRVAADKA